MPSEESDENAVPTSSISTLKIIRSAPRRQFPIRISDQGPLPFDLQSQERVMRWKHLIAFDWFPTWKTEPDTKLIEEVVRDHLNTCGFNSDAITVEYFAAGTHNKLYTINTTDAQTGLPAECLFRVALPIYPWYKVESDVATTEFVRHFTDIPVPLIYAYDSSTNNKLGLEWMLMEKITGTPLEEAWPKINSDDQTRLTKKIAEWLDQLSSFAFDKIGSLYMRYAEKDLDFYIGPMVDQNFYDGRRLAYKIDRGPFPSLQTYYDAVLDAQQQEIKDPRYLEEYHRLTRATEHEKAQEARERHLKAKAEKSRDSAYRSNDEDGAGDEAASCTSSRKHTRDHDSEATTEDTPVELLQPDDVSDIFDGRVLLFYEKDLIGVPEALEALRTGLPSLVQEPVGDRHSTMITHHDLSLCNILVDINGRILALVDWEMVSLDPPVRKEHFPQFLQSYDTHDAPTIQDLELYGEQDFRRDWKTYMLTRLRRLFRERLEELRSRYLLIFDEPSGLHKALNERIFVRWKHRGDVSDWVDIQLAPTDDDSAYDSDEDEPDLMPDVGSGKVEYVEVGVRGDDNQLAEEMGRMETENSTWGRVCCKCGQSLEPSWMKALAFWFIELLEDYSG
ncbi:hypothetical protein MMC08_009113 [Hypocenomyce scalaris]|nr:hypothetical protein [Hypocenomyce scalaris]